VNYFEHNAGHIELAVIEGDPRELPPMERIELATAPDTIALEAERLRLWFLSMARKQQPR
jgi:hypothetical protein